MEQSSPPTIADASNPFMEPGQRTMAELMALIGASEGLSTVRRRNLISSIRRFCAALGYEPAEVPANHWYFRERLRRFHPLSVGLTKKRWQTIRSDVSFALKWIGTGAQGRPLAKYASKWAALKQRLPSTTFVWGLTGLARFCSTRGIDPTEVNGQVIEAFALALRRESFKTKTERTVRQACLLWNKAADALPEFCLPKVALPSHREIYTSPWDRLPVGLRHEADAWLESMSQEADLLSDEGPIKPLRPASINTYRYNIRQIFAALVQKGILAESINSLGVLVQPENAKKALEFFLERNKGVPTSQISGIAHVLVLIAEAGGRADQATIQKLKRYRKQLSRRSHGLRPRPRNALRPFTDAANIEKFLTLPLRIYERMRRKTDFTEKDALAMQSAVALELLLMRPIRRKNLAALRLDENLIRSGRNMFIVIAERDVKNEYEHDYAIPRESAGLIEFYLKRILPLLGPNPGRWVFPGAIPNRHKCDEQVGRQIAKAVREDTGLHFFPHLARHLGAFLYLKENPGNFEVVRRVLAHKSLTTTTRSYASYDDENAVRLFDALILRIRDSIRREVGSD